MDGIGRGQHGVVSTALLSYQTFHVLGVRHMMHMHIPRYLLESLKVKAE